MLIRFGGEGSTVWSQTNSQIHLGNILLNQSTIHCTGYSCQIELSISLQSSDLRAYLLRQMCKSAQTATNIILPPHCTNGGNQIFFLSKCVLKSISSKRWSGKIQNHSMQRVCVPGKFPRLLQNSKEFLQNSKDVFFTEVTFHSTLLLTLEPKFSVSFSLSRPPL